MSAHNEQCRNIRLKLMRLNSLLKQPPSEALYVPPITASFQFNSRLFRNIVKTTNQYVTVKLDNNGSTGRVPLKILTDVGPPYNFIHDFLKICRIIRIGTKDARIEIAANGCGQTNKIIIEYKVLKGFNPLQDDEGTEVSLETGSMQKSEETG